MPNRNLVFAATDAWDIIRYVGYQRETSTVQIATPRKGVFPL